MDLHRPVVVTDGGPWAEHDHACSVCRTRKSVLDLGTGVFLPCWDCQEKGWLTRQSPRFARWFRKWGGLGRERIPVGGDR